VASFIKEVLGLVLIDRIIPPTKTKRQKAAQTISFFIGYKSLAEAKLFYSMKKEEKYNKELHGNIVHLFSVKSISRRQVNA